MKDASTYGCPRRGSTHGRKCALAPPNGNDFLEHEREQQRAARAEDDVVDAEQGIEALRCAVLHDFTRAEDDSEVGNEGRADRCPCGERGLALHVGCQVVRDRLDGQDGDEEVCERSHWKGCGGREWTEGECRMKEKCIRAYF